MNRYEWITSIITAAIVATALLIAFLRAGAQ